MMLQKYNLNKFDKWVNDDFREAMQMIVRNDNDALFDQYL